MTLTSNIYLVVQKHQKKAPGSAFQGNRLLNDVQQLQFANCGGEYGALKQAMAQCVRPPQQPLALAQM